MGTFEDELAAGFRQIGLTESAARVAAAGRPGRDNWTGWGTPDAGASPASALTVATAAVEVAAREALGLSEADAKVYAAKIREREVGRGGAEHAKVFLVSLSEALTTKATAQ